MRQEIEVTRGATEPFRIYIAENGTAYTLKDGEKLVFGVKEKPEDETLLIRKVITESPYGIATITISPDETIGLKYGRYAYDIGLVIEEEYYPVIKISPFVIQPNITKRGDAT